MHGSVPLSELSPVSAVEAERSSGPDAALDAQRSGTSIAVLPFVDLGADPDQRYFSDGVTEDVILELSRFRELLVIGRASSFACRPFAADVKRVASELGARYVLEGSLRRSRDQLRIAVRLLDGTTGSLISADRFEGSLADVFEVQTEVARSIAGRIAPELAIAEMQRTERLPLGDLQAYDMVLRARARMIRGADTEDAGLISEGIEIARQALHRDPLCSEAYRVLAWGYCLRGELGFFGPRSQDDYAAAENAAARLRDLDPRSHAAYSIAGHVAMRQLRHAEALACLRLAHELNPNAPTTLRWLSWEESNHGLSEPARSHAELSLRLSPRDHLVSLGHWTVALADYVAGDLPRSLANARQAVATNPRFGGYYILLAACLAEMGDLGQTRVVVEKVTQLCPGLIESRAAGNTYFADPGLARRYVKALTLATEGAARGSASTVERDRGPAPGISAALPCPEAITALTGREREVLGLIGKGLSNGAIADALSISEHTAKRHVANILTKLDLPRRSAAAGLAGRLGLG